MFRVLSCLGGEHDPRLVALAGIVCVVSSIVSINLIHRARVAKSHARIVWIATAGVACGCGIWATHFIAMLAFEPGVPIAYDLLLTSLSFLSAAVLTAGGIAIAVAGERRWSALLGGAVVGLAIASMHFLGMSALEVPGHAVWSADLVLASIGLGMLFAMVALDTAIHRRDISTTMIAAAALSAAIGLLHFTAMGAVQIVPDPTRMVTPFSIAPGMLAFGVATATTAVLAIGAAGLIVDQRISEKSEQLEAALHNMSQGLCFLNAKSEVLLVNGRFLEMFAIPPERIVPRMPMAELMDIAEQSVPFAADNRSAIRKWVSELKRDHQSGNMIFRRTDGRIFSICHAYMPAQDGWVETFEDITERRQAEEKIEYLARHDSLTGLANRMHFREQLEKALDGINRIGMFAVLCLDLDHFKTVNDTLGHQGGDHLLQTAAERLRGAVRKGDLVARLGGDEFAILQLIKDQPAAATALAARLVEAMSGPVETGDQRLSLGVSVGIALAPADGTSADQLLKNADLALYQAKADGRGTHRFFAPEMNTPLKEPRALVA